MLLLVLLDAEAMLSEERHDPTRAPEMPAVLLDLPDLIPHDTAEHGKANVEQLCTGPGRIYREIVIRLLHLLPLGEDLVAIASQTVL